MTSNFRDYIEFQVHFTDKLITGLSYSQKFYEVNDLLATYSELIKAMNGLKSKPIRVKKIIKMSVNGDLNPN